ncbi:ACT domain-containing protein [Aeromicrobium marinum]|uniref:ACT domain-containing protein n=1 Tax=Aeromicrobium marinum TaxID=219314 RepID=UPI000590FD3D|nr:ACT domain-containing protein [Aeromicrobium marinum]
MAWRVRTTLQDRPGMLAGVAAACGDAGLNIVAMQVFGGGADVTDEFVVEAPPGWDDLAVAGVFAAAGGTGVAVTRVEVDGVVDAPTRYLRGVHEILEEGRDVEEVLRELLETEPPDVLDYAGHDVLDLTRRNGSVLRISRAVAFTPAERARAQALLSLVSDAGVDLPLIAPSPFHPLPLVREATLADIDNVAALHGRCSAATLYARYQAPLRMPMTTRMARRLVIPDTGTAWIAQTGLDVVGHAVLECVDQAWTCQILVEDAWQGRGIDSMLVKQAAAAVLAGGGDQVVLLSAGANDALLRAVGSAGYVARVERHDDLVRITVPLRR